jgi:hypothetical protein
MIPVVGDSRTPTVARTKGSNFAASSNETKRVGTPIDRVNLWSFTSSYGYVSQCDTYSIGLIEIYRPPIADLSVLLPTSQFFYVGCHISHIARTSYPFPVYIASFSNYWSHSIFRHG